MAGTPLNHNVDRKVLVVTRNVNLGRGPVTCIQDSIVSRDLCSINLISDRVFIIMNKPYECEDRFLHGVHINGEHLKVGAGVRKELHSGDVISLFGPTGYAYRVEL